MIKLLVLYAYVISMIIYGGYIFGKYVQRVHKPHLLFMLIAIFLAPIWPIVILTIVVTKLEH